MRTAPALSVAAALLLLLPGCVPTAPRLQRTADGRVEVGRTGGGRGFRVVHGGIALAMQAPAGWRVALCTEEPLNADVVCVAPDQRRFAAITVQPAAAGGLADGTTAAPESYLQELRRFKDPAIQMEAAAPVTLPDGRTVPVWGFASAYWGEHLYVKVAEPAHVVWIEVESRGPAPDRADLHEVLGGLFGTYRVRSNPALERTATGGDPAADGNVRPRQ